MSPFMGNHGYYPIVIKGSPTNVVPADDKLVTKIKQNHLLYRIPFKNSSMPTRPQQKPTIKSILP